MFETQSLTSSPTFKWLISRPNTCKTLTQDYNIEVKPDFQPYFESLTMAWHHNMFETLNPKPQTVPLHPNLKAKPLNARLRLSTCFLLWCAHSSGDLHVSFLFFTRSPIDTRGNLGRKMKRLGVCGFLVRNDHRAAVAAPRDNKKGQRGGFNV